MISALIILHVLGAAVWTGGHLVLAVTVLPRAIASADAGVVQRFEAGYERLGIPALLIQILTGVALAIHHAGSVQDWLGFSDPVANLILVKATLLALTLALALHARLRVLPELDVARLRALAWHIWPVTIIGVLLVVAGVLIRTQPAASLVR